MRMLLLPAVLAALLLLATRCRRGHPGLAALRGWSYAHRGLHGDGVPENSMAAFRAALAGGYGAELDVHLLADGGLAVIHDSLLARTTGLPGRVEELNRADLGRCFLGGSRETIPEFSQVLALFQGRAPLIIELKSAGDNPAALTQAVCQALEGYPGPFCLESFDPRCLRWLRENRPELIRGQLAEDFLKTGGLPGALCFLLTHDLLNFWTVPDFIAYNFDHRRDTPCNSLCRRLWGAQLVAWTLRSPADYDTAKKEGWLPIFEGFRP